MSLRRKIITFVAPAALLLAGGCAESFQANVSRFQMMPPPHGQSFFVQAADPRLQGSIEFQTYAQQVAARLTALGYRQGEPGQASLVVSVNYGVDNGHTEVVTHARRRPGVGLGSLWIAGASAIATAIGRFGGRPIYGRGFYYGWNDPFWYDPFGYPDINSYTFFISHLDMKIRSAADGKTLFEGKAQRALDRPVAAAYRAEPGGGDVHRLPGPFGRGCAHHDPAAPQGRPGAAGADDPGTPSRLTRQTPGERSPGVFRFAALP